MMSISLSYSLLANTFIFIYFPSTFKAVLMNTKLKSVKILALFPCNILLEERKAIDSSNRSSMIKNGVQKVSLQQLSLGNLIDPDRLIDLYCN